MNRSAFVNEAGKTVADSTHNFLSVQLKGSDGNRNGIGLKVTLYAGGKVQYAKQNIVRRYMSSVDGRLYFGVGNASQIDSIKIVWTDGRMQLLKT